jgi:hypothetical protein
VHESNCCDEDAGGTVNICQVTSKQIFMHPITSSSSSTPPHPISSNNIDRYSLQSSSNHYCTSNSIRKDIMSSDWMLSKGTNINNSSSPHTSCHVSEQITSSLSYDEEDLISSLHSSQAEYPPDNQQCIASLSNIAHDTKLHSNMTEMGPSTSLSSNSIEQPTIHSNPFYIRSNVKESSTPLIQNPKLHGSPRHDKIKVIFHYLHYC